MTTKKIVQIVVNILLLAALIELLFTADGEVSLLIGLAMMYIVTMLAVNMLFERK